MYVYYCAMTITDPEKKRLAQKSRLDVKICLDCKARNSRNATRCRKCHRNHLRLKNRTIRAKK